MKRVLLIFIILNSTCVSVSRILATDDLGKLFIKYIISELSHDEMKIVKNILEIFKPLWHNKGDINKGISCFLCRSAFTALFFLVNIGTSDTSVEGAAKNLCSLATDLPKVCGGYIKLNYPILKYIIKHTRKANPETICGLILQSTQENVCSFNDSRFDWEIYLFPKIWKTNKKFSFFQDITNLTIALISNAHVDPSYKPFGTADCNEPTCCRQDQAPRLFAYNTTVDEKNNDAVFKINDKMMIDTSKISKVNISSSKSIIFKSTPAGYWGDYRKCDTPVWAYEDTIKRIATHKNIDIVYYLGGNIDHHFWETTYEQNIQVNKLIVDKMKLHFGRKVTVIPVIGNHEAQPCNQFAPPSVTKLGLNTTWLYKSLASQWRGHLNDLAVAAMSKRGQFSTLVRPGLRVISLNNNVAHKLNWWLHFYPLIQKRHLEWLVRELYIAELLGEKVHILSHIPPGDADLTYTWTKEYYRVIERFSDTIVAQFAAHTEADDMKLFVDKTTNKAFDVTWGAGAISTYSASSNRNYKIVTLDKTYKPSNIENYIYNLTEANLTPEQTPRWFKLYDLETIYNLQNLSASSIDNLMYEMVKDKKFLLDLYVFYLSKASDAAPSCDVNCKLEALCKLVTSVLWERKRCEELKKLYFS